MSGRVRLWMFSVKEVRAADPAEGAQRNSQVLMIARRHDSAAALAKAGDALAIGHTQPIAVIDREQPKLVKVRLVKRVEDWIITRGISFAITSRHFTEL